MAVQPRCQREASGKGQGLGYGRFSGAVSVHATTLVLPLKLSLLHTQPAGSQPWG